MHLEKYLAQPAIYSCCDQLVFLTVGQKPHWCDLREKTLTAFVNASLSMWIVYNVGHCLGEKKVEGLQKAHPVFDQKHFLPGVPVRSPHSFIFALLLGSPVAWSMQEQRFKIAVPVSMFCACPPLIIAPSLVPSCSCFVHLHLEHGIARTQCHSQTIASNECGLPSSGRDARSSFLRRACNF